MQLGENFFPDGSKDRTGYSVALSRNGLSVAVGAPEAGDVRIYRYKAGYWNYMANIDSFYNQTAGTSVAMDDTGLIVAIGAPFAQDDDYDDDDIWSLSSGAPSSIFQYGSVRVFEINRTAADHEDLNSHQQIGSDIIGPEVGSEFGWYIDISGTGNVVAIGSQAIGYIKVVRFSQEAKDWQDFGNPIDCTGMNDVLIGSPV
jgi:hypothetical protein